MICTKNLVESDLPEFVSLLASLNAQVKDSTAHVNSLLEKFAEISRDDGLSYLEMKCHLFLEYLIDVTHLMLIKMDGKSLADYSCVDRLVRTRTILEKIRPIDKKLTYQIDKLIKMAFIQSNKGEVHPLSFKPNVDDLITKEDSDNSDEEVITEQESTQQVYVPPKVTAVPYEEDDQLSKKEKKLQKSKKQLLSKSLLEDLRTEYSEAPEEICSKRNGKRARMQEKEDERERFEEDNLRRLTLTKKDKKNRKALNDLDEVVKIGSFRGLDDDESSAGEERYQPKKKKGKFQKKFKKRMQKRKK